LPPPIFVFPFYPFFWRHEISIWVLGGFSRLKKFLQGRKTVFPASRNFFKAENLYFQLREVSLREKNCISGFAKFLGAIYTVFLVSRKLLSWFGRFVVIVAFASCLYGREQAVGICFSEFGAGRVYV